MHFTQSSMPYRAALIVAFCAMSFVLAPSPALAAVNVNQTASVTYGKSITFSLSGQSAAPVTDALLHIHVLNQPESDVKPETLTGGTSFTASADVPVAALNLPPFAQISYNWELTTASGAVQADSQSLVYDDNTLPWKWAVETRDNLVLHWDGSNSDLAEAALTSASSSLASLSDLTGARPTSPIHIYLYPDLASMTGTLRSHQQRIQDWVAAYAIPQQDGIFVAESQGPDEIPGLERDMAHELTHLLVYAAAGSNPDKVPGWLNEGLAIDASPTPDTSLDTQLNQAIHDGVLLSLNDLCAPNFTALPASDAPLAYAQSASFVRYIEARYGTSQIKGLLSAYANGASCAGGVSLVLGTSLADLETQWHGELGQDYTGPSAQEPSLLPWALAWLASLALAYLFVFPRATAVEDRPVNLTRHSIPPVADSNQN